MKKMWTAPVIETLDVSMTMAGHGAHYVDWSYVGGKHLEINDDPKWKNYPVPPS
ncbi:paeninodin family lasso peptide [Cohnella faecalis]|uniref:Paeninodin family lasso peptide n=1 Tax=Cohnella faecalis TaxID=2315694 RepID=A0A398CU46_9BACL|nr:paeninodin family lasso peptide [Cohnella faecalis]